MTRITCKWIKEDTKNSYIAKKKLQKSLIISSGQTNMQGDNIEWWKNTTWNHDNDVHIYNP